MSMSAADIFAQIQGVKVKPISPQAPGITPSTNVFADVLGTAGNKPMTAEGERPPNLENAPGNPLSFVGGMLYNAIGDIPEIVEGLGALVTNAVHDVGGAVLQAVPGEQGGWEREIQEEGYRFSPENLAAMGGAIGDDYASRYGFHGPGEFADQIYSNPLSYVFDALIVGGAAAKVAKLGALPPSLATKVLGMAPEELSMAQSAAVSMGGKASKVTPVTAVTDLWRAESLGTVGLTTSLNPVKRFIQNTALNRIMTRSVENTYKIAEGGDPGLIARGMERFGAAPITEQAGLTKLGFGANPSTGLVKQISENLAEAGVQGQRVLRPWAARSAATPWSLTRVVQRVFGTHLQASFAAQRDALTALKPIYDAAKEAGMDVDDVAMRMGQMTEQAGVRWERSAGIRNGQAMLMETMPNDGPVTINTGNIPPIVGETPVVSYAQRGINIAADAPDVPVGDTEQLAAILRRNPGASHMDFVSPTIKMEEKTDDLARRMAYNVPVGDMNNVATEAAAVADDIGGTIIGVKDFFAEGQSWWNGVSVFYDTPKGIAEVNFATSDVLKAQQAAGYVNNLQRVSSIRLQQVGQTMRHLHPDNPEYATLLQEHQLLRNDIFAAQAMTKRIFQGSLRSLNHPEGYAPELKFIDDLYLWEHQWGARPFVEGYVRSFPDSSWATQGRKGPFTEMVERAYGPLRYEVYEKMLADIRTDVQARIQTLTHTGKGPMAPEARQLEFALRRQEFVAEAEKVLAQYGFSRSSTPGIVSAVLADFEAAAGELSTSGRKLYPITAKTAEIFSDVVRKFTRQQAVVDPTLPGWGWDTFYRVTPQLPSYFPHMKHIKPSEVLARTPAQLSRMREGLPAPAKGWYGELLENGMMDANSQRVYQTMANQFIRSKELMDNIETLRGMGREVSLEELTEWGAKGFTGEVLWSPDMLIKDVKVHDMMGDFIYAGIRQGRHPGEAINEALRMINSSIQEDAVQAMKFGKVYAIPKHISDQISKTIFRTFSPHTMRVFWDGPMNLWRASVLGLSPRWIVYNVLGNVMFGGIDNPAALRRMKIFGDLDKKNTAFIDYVLTHTPAPKSFKGTLGSVTQRGFYTAESSALPTNWGSAADVYPGLTQLADRAKNLYLSPGKVSSRIRHWNSVREQAARRGVALDELTRADGWHRVFETDLDIATRIAKEGLTEEMANRMLTAANRTLGDYTGLSAIERDVVRRFVAPFYPFYRHVVRFTARMIWDHPLKSQVFNQMEQFDEEMAPVLPEYLGQSIFLGELGGKDAYWNLRSWNPLMVLAEGRPTNVLNPMVKTGLQGITGTNEFGDKYEDPNVYESGNGMQFIKTADGWEPFEGNIHPPWWKMYAGQFGFPMNYFNLQGYKNRTPLTVGLGQFGASISRFDTDKYRMNELEGEMQALLYGSDEL